MALLLRNRLSLAAYKIRTQQIHTPLGELASLSDDCPDTAVSIAIQRFRESKQRQEQAKFFRQHCLSTICRREARVTRRQQKKLLRKASRPLKRGPSSIVEVISEQEERGLLSP